jgi:hypothetical protein
LFNGLTVQSDIDGRYRLELTDELSIAQNYLAVS